MNFKKRINFYIKIVESIELYDRIHKISVIFRKLVYSLLQF